MNYLDFIDNKEQFKEMIKATLDKVAFAKLDGMKKSIANDFLTGGEK